MIPSFLMEVYFGHAGVHVASMGGASGGGSTSGTVCCSAALVVVIVVMALVGRAAHSAIQKAAADPNAGPEP